MDPPCRYTPFESVFENVPIARTGSRPPSTQGGGMQMIVLPCLVVPNLCSSHSFNEGADAEEEV